MTINPSFRLRILSAFSFFYSLLVIILGYGLDIVPAFILKRIQRDNFIIFLWIIGIILFLIFGISFTRFGLNTGAGKDPTGETERRNKELSQACPLWSYIWYGIIPFLAIICLVGSYFGNHLNLPLIFAGEVAFICGLWFLFVYHIAKKLFSNEEESRQDSGRSTCE